MKLKEKDWKNIMNAAAEYSNAIKSDNSSSTTHKRFSMTEEELDLVWDSESESDSEMGPSRGAK